MKLFRLFSVGLYILLFSQILTAQTVEQIYHPEGVNMPGDWNSWTNSNDSTAMGNFKMNYRSVGGGQYITRLNVKATGTDVVGGTYKMLFTSGPESNTFQNKWTNTTLVLNSTANLVLNTGSDNNVTVENGFYYSFVFDDKGYNDSRVSMMRTSGIPVFIDSVLGLPTQSITSGEVVSVNIKLNTPKSVEEKIYIRYSTDNFKTSSSVEVTGFSGTNSAIGTIPGHANGQTIEFYVLSTTVSSENWGNSADHFTLNINNNDDKNYVISFGDISTLIHPIHNSVQINPRDTLTWTEILSSDKYRLQIAPDSGSTTTIPIIDTLISFTSFTIPRGKLAYNSTYLWRVKNNDELAQWSFQNRFTTRATIGYVNIETGSAVINQGETALIEGKVYLEGFTIKEGTTTDLKAWIGVSNSNTNPINWPQESWTSAGFSKQILNDDVYSAEIGSELTYGTYYYAFKYQYADDDTVYAGFSSNGGGFWNGTENTNGVLTITKLPELLYPLQEEILVSVLPTFSWSNLGAESVYDFQLSTISDPNFQDPSISALGLTDTTFTLDGSLSNASTYIWRVRLGGDTPQSYSEAHVFKTIGLMGFYNFQFVEKDTLVQGEQVFAYAQVFINGYTTATEVAEGLQASIGVHSENTDPSTWPTNTWQAADLNESSLELNNDEYHLNIGDNLVPGEYFLAARFSYGDSIFYGGYSFNGGGKWDSEVNTNKRILVITETSNESKREINSFSLSQNYPNPFNPSTEIRFSIPQSELVTLTVYNVLGEQIATLIQSNLTAGSHSISFNTNNAISSGVYFYHLQAGNFVETKQMLLVK